METTILQVLAGAKRNPVACLGEKSLFTLEAYLSGILDGLASLGHTIGGRSEERFDLWLARQNHTSISKDLFCTLTLIAPSDSDAFDLFFAKLEQFLQQQSGPTLWTEKVSSSVSDPTQDALDLSSLLDRLRKQPYPFLRNKSLTLLSAYINGQISSRKIMFGNVRCRPDLAEFALWLQKRYPQLHESDHRHWVRVLKYVSQREENESLAFDLFFILREEWTKETVQPNVIEDNLC